MTFALLALTLAADPGGELTPPPPPPVVAPADAPVPPAPPEAVAAPEEPEGPPSGKAQRIVGAALLGYSAVTFLGAAVVATDWYRGLVGNTLQSLLLVTCLVEGAGIAITGGVLLGVGLKRGAAYDDWRKTVSVSVVPLPGGAAGGLRFAF